MSADLLRRAAQKLREHANAAAEVMSGFVSEANEAPRPDYPAGSLGAQCQAIGRFSDLWHPPVALALADLLDDFANAGFPHPLADAIARAVLREPDPNCGHCGRRIGLDRHGKFAGHNDPSTGVRCAGAYKPPTAPREPDPNGGA